MIRYCSSVVRSFQFGFPSPAHNAARAIYFFETQGIGGSCKTLSQTRYILCFMLVLIKLAPSVDRAGSMAVLSCK